LRDASGTLDNTPFYRHIAGALSTDNHPIATTGDRHRT
jgi:hypothetical protein